MHKSKCKSRRKKSRKHDITKPNKTKQKSNNETKQHTHAHTKKGDGNQHHPSTEIFYPRGKVATTIVIADLPRAKILDDVFWFGVWRMHMVCDNSNHGDVLYEVHACICIVHTHACALCMRA